MTPAQRAHAALMRRRNADLRRRVDSIRRSIAGFRRERNKRLLRLQRTGEFLEQVRSKGAI